MHNNGPITGHEIDVALEHPIISKTDLKGIITYANPYFVAISGYRSEEATPEP